MLGRNPFGEFSSFFFLSHFSLLNSLSLSLFVPKVPEPNENEIAFILLNSNHQNIKIDPPIRSLHFLPSHWPTWAAIYYLFHNFWIRICMRRENHQFIKNDPSRFHFNPPPRTHILQLETSKLPKWAFFKIIKISIIANMWPAIGWDFFCQLAHSSTFKHWKAQFPI